MIMKINNKSYDEIEILHNYINIRQHLVINGEKEIVKRVVVEAISNHVDKPLFAYIDLTDKKTISEAAHVLIDSFIDGNFGFKEFLSVAEKDISAFSKQFLKQLDATNNTNKIKVSEFQIEIQGILNFMSDDNIQSNIESFVSAFELFDSIAQDVDKKVVVFVGEFQKLVEYPGIDEENIMWPLRSVIQNSKNITLFIEGSKPILINELIQHPDSAFYGSFMSLAI